MIKDDFFPETKTVAPPEGLDEAVERISNVDILTKLAFTVFRSVEEFRMAMSECGYNMDIKPILISGRIKTYTAMALARDGAKWKILLNEVGGNWMQVINVAITGKGASMTDEEYKFLREGCLE